MIVNFVLHSQIFEQNQFCIRTVQHIMHMVGCHCVLRCKSVQNYYALVGGAPEPYTVQTNAANLLHILCMHRVMNY